MQRTVSYAAGFAPAQADVPQRGAGVGDGAPCG